MANVVMRFITIALGICSDMRAADLNGDGGIDLDEYRRWPRPKSGYVPDWARHAACRNLRPIQDQWILLGLVTAIAVGLLRLAVLAMGKSTKLRFKRSERVITCLPHGVDCLGRTIYIEVVRFGLKENFTRREQRYVLPVAFEHNDGKLRVCWGHSDTVMWAKVGRVFVAPESCVQSSSPTVEVGSSKGFMGPMGPKPQLEAHIPGSMYDPYGKMPKERSGFRVASTTGGRQMVWWASTVLVSKEAPGRPYFFVLRHTLYSLQAAMAQNHALQVISDYTGECVGFLGSDDFPMPCVDDALCLADNLPGWLVEAFDEEMKKGRIPPEPAMLYDLVIVPCKWNTSKAGFKHARSEFGRAIGHTLYMRAFDFENVLHNGVTCGTVPDTEENRNLARTCGVVAHQVANSKGGSGSFAWEGDAICLMHMGCKGNNLNYGVPGPVLRQLEGMFIGRDPIKSVDLGFKRFVTDMKRKAEQANALVDVYTPLFVGDHATEHLADELTNAMVGEAPGLEAPITAGSKKDNARRHAAGQYIHSLAKRDYNRARALVKSFRLATNASNSAMAQLYYWMDGGEDEEYNLRYTKRWGEDIEHDEDEEWERNEQEWDRYLDAMLWGESPLPQPPTESPPDTADAPAEVEPDSPDDGVGDAAAAATAARAAAAAGRAEATAASAAAAAAVDGGEPEVPCLHSPAVFELPTPSGPAAALGAASPPGLEAPQKGITVTQVSTEALNREVPVYATRLEECDARDSVDPAECLAFDELCDSLLADPSALKTTTMAELMERCAKYQFAGKLTDSSYWKRYIGPNVVPQGTTNSARKIPHTTPKAKVKSRGTSKPMVEPAFEGLFAKFPEWNWDPATGQAKGVWPPTGPKDVADSLASQLKDRGSALPLDPRTVPTLASGYPAHQWDGTETVYACIKRHLNALVMDKGVGWHLPPGINTKRDYVQGLCCVPETVVKMLMVLTTSTQWLSKATPWQLYQAGFLMPEILKIKHEAHKRKKVDAKRWRLIWQTCITQEVLSRIFHADQNTAEVAAYQADLTHSKDFPTFGNATGMGHHDEGLEQTRRALKRLIGNDVGCAADRKAWDMSITRHLWMADARLRAILCDAGGCPSAYQEAQIKMGLLLSAHVVQVGSFLYQIDTFGVVGSGILSTASSNGKINQLLALDFIIHNLPPGSELPPLEVIEAFLSLVMGDDSVMRGSPANVAEFVKHHAERGVEVTGAEKGEDPGPIKSLSAVPFTSHVYDLTTDAYPAGIFDNVEKLAWRLALVKGLRKEQALGVMFAVRHSPHKEVVRSMIAAANPELADLEYTEGAGISLDTFL